MSKIQKSIYTLKNDIVLRVRMFPPFKVLELF